MKVGDYVRTRDGIIGKLNIINDTIAVANWQGDYELEDITIYEVNDNKVYKSEIIKSAPNIIDLIEVGDILSFQDKSICRVLEITDNGYYLLKDFGGEQYYERKEWMQDFASIITKELFEEMEYKL